MRGKDSDCRRTHVCLWAAGRGHGRACEAEEEADGMDDEQLMHRRRVNSSFNRNEVRWSALEV